jgi:hypothetical protein
MMEVHDIKAGAFGERNCGAKEIVARDSEFCQG